MRGRWYFGIVGIFSSLPQAFAQFPPPAPFPLSSPMPGSRGSMPFSSPLPGTRLPDPLRPAPPMNPSSYSQPFARPLPQGALPTPTALPDGSVMSASRVETPLPHPEARIAIDTGAMTAKKINGVWQIWSGPRPFKNLGSDEVGARDVIRVMHDLHPTEWVTIGSPRPVVEYGLTGGRPTVGGAFARAVLSIDLRSVRVEPIKGVWCLKDDASIHFNFGLSKADADQALAAVRKYGFNRIGVVGGDPNAPALTYFFAALEAEAAKPMPVNALALAAQENRLARTGIPIPGVGYMGEMIPIDARKIEVRRDGIDWVVFSGNEPLARFGQDQGAARDAQRLIQDGHFTELGRGGPTGCTFFLTNGQPPTRVPLFVQSRRFDSNGLKVMQQGMHWTVTERGRHLFDVASQQEGEAVILLLKHYHFDQLCQVGSSPRTSLTFLAKGR